MSVESHSFVPVEAQEAVNHPISDQQSVEATTPVVEGVAFLAPAVEAGQGAPEAITSESPAQAVKVVDVAALEEAKRARRRQQSRESKSRYYHRMKQAADAGDGDALSWWARQQQQTREAQRRWRQNHPEEHSRKVMKYRRRSKQPSGQGGVDNPEMVS